MTQQTARRADEPNLGHILLWGVRVGVLLVLITPLVVSEGVFFPYVVGKAVYARSMIEITFALWVPLVLLYREYRPPRSWVILAFAAWLAVSWVAGLLGVSPTRSMWSTYERMQGIFDLAHWFAFVLMASSAFRSLTDWRLLLSANLGLSSLMCALGLGQHFGAWDISYLGESSRIQSTLGNATYVGAYAMVNAMTGVGLLVHSLGRVRSEGRAVGRARQRARRRRREGAAGPAFDYLPLVRVLWVIAVLINLWALWHSGTRGAAAGLLAGVLVFTVGYGVWGRLRPARIVAAGLVAAVMVAAGLFIVVRTTDALDPVVESSLMLERLSRVGLEDSSIKGRFVSAGAGLTAVRDRPLFGWGPENYLVAWGRYFDLDSGIRERFDQAHSKVIEELTTKGAVGALAYLGLWGSMAYVLVRSLRRRSGYEQLFIGVMGATLVAYFVQNLFLFDTPATVMQFALLVAFVVSEDARVQAQPDGRPPWSIQVPGRLPDWSRSVVSALSSPIASTTISAIVVALMIAALALFNVRAYTAAADIRDGLRPERDWPDRVGAFEDAIEGFPGLSNYARIQLAVTSSMELRELSDSDFATTVELVSREAERGRQAEPENWLLQAHLGRFYHVAGTRAPANVEVARQHVDLAVELAPRTREVVNLLEEQERIEEFLGK